MKYFFVFVSCLLVCQVMEAQEPKKPILSPDPKDKRSSEIENSRSRWDLVWRSAIVPGWGLIHAKAYRRGILTLTTTSIVLAVEYDGHREEASRKEDYHQASNTLLYYYLTAPQTNSDILLLLFAQRNSALDVYEYSRTENDLKLSLLAVKYLLQLGYSYWYGTFWEKEEVTNGFRFDLLPDSGNSPYSSASSFGYPSQKAVFSYNYVF